MNDGVVLANNVFGRGVGFTRMYLYGDWMVNMKNISLDILKQPRTVVKFDNVQEALDFLTVFKEQCSTCRWTARDICERYDSSFTFNPNFDGERFKKLTYDEESYYSERGYSVIRFFELCVDQGRYVDMTEDLISVLF